MKTISIIVLVCGMILLFIIVNNYYITYLEIKMDSSVFKCNNGSIEIHSDSLSRMFNDPSGTCFRSCDTSAYFIDRKVQYKSTCTIDTELNKEIAVCKCQETILSRYIIPLFNTN